MIDIRFANKQDIDVLLDLWWQLHLYHTEKLNAKKDFVYVKDVKERMRSHFLKTVIPSMNILVASDNSEIIGFCELGEGKRPPIYKTDRLLHIWCIYVIPEARMKGIGTLLVQKAREVGKERGFKELELDAHINNTDAEMFYSSIGLHKRLVQFVGSV